MTLTDHDHSATASSTTLVRLSPLRSAYLEHLTVLRFYAHHWDPRYAGLAEPPQKRLRSPPPQRPKREA